MTRRCGVTTARVARDRGSGRSPCLFASPAGLSSHRAEGGAAVLVCGCVCGHTTHRRAHPASRERVARRRPSPVARALQIESGAQLIQLFDSWAGHLSPRDYDVFAGPYQQMVIEAIKKAHPEVRTKRTPTPPPPRRSSRPTSPPRAADRRPVARRDGSARARDHHTHTGTHTHTTAAAPCSPFAQVPIIIYINKSGALLERMANVGADILSVDWTVTLTEARKRIGDSMGLQVCLRSPSSRATRNPCSSSRNPFLVGPSERRGSPPSVRRRGTHAAVAVGSAVVETARGALCERQARGLFA